jgi:D-alanine--poly(phosphoribitol) ligase subunit 2
MSVADEVIATIQAVTNDAEVAVDRDLNLFELQVLDSLRTIELVVALSARFDTDIALSEIDRSLWATPNKIISFMESRVGVRV